MKIKLISQEHLNQLMKLRKKFQGEELEALLEGLGVYEVSSVRKNFEEGGRPQKWAKLNLKTLKRKRGVKILVDSGLLAGGITYEVDTADRAVLIGPSGPSVKYARRHNYGDIGGKPIPKRQFLVMQEEDAEYVNDFIKVWIF